MEGVTKSQVISGFIWKWLERSGVQGIQIIVQIVLARNLLPKDFGVVALITIFIAIANVFVQSGLNTALIQKKDADEVDFSSVFFLSLFIAFSLYVLLFLLAPFIANFYEEKQLVLIIKVLSITLIFGAINSIQNAIVARRMQFKRIFFSSLCGVITSGIVSIVMVYSGFGVWALAGQQIINSLLITIILWFTVRWRPKFVFSIERIKILYSYGWKVLGASLVALLAERVNGLVIGKVYTSEILGYYDRGYQFPSLIVGNINGAITSVLLPAMSSHQDHKLKLKNMTRRAVSVSTFFVFPAMAILAAIAEPLIRVVLTEKWLPCVLLLQLECLSFATMPQLTAIIQGFYAIGRTDVRLKLEIIKASLSIVSLIIFIPYGIYIIVGAKAVIAIIMVIVSSFVGKALIGYRLNEQMRDIVPSLVLSVLMGAVVYCLQYLMIRDLYTLILQIIVGIVLYFGLTYILKFESLNYVSISVRDYLKRRQ